MPWIQIYDPAGYPLLSILAAALPLVVLLVLLGIFEISAQWAALCGLGVALLVSVLVYGMPPVNAAAAAGYGVAFGLLPIGWIVLSAVFLYNLTVATGQFEIIKHSIATLSADRRVQALLIAFSFGAFIEGFLHRSSRRKTFENRSDFLNLNRFATHFKCDFNFSVT